MNELDRVTTESTHESEEIHFVNLRLFSKYATCAADTDRNSIRVSVSFGSMTNSCPMPSEPKSFL